MSTSMIESRIIIHHKEDQTKMEYQAKSTVMRKLLLILSVIILITIAPLIAFLSKKLNSNDQKICTRPQCLIAASVLQNSLNLSANPCNDFYSYACGGWILNNNIPHNKQMWSKADLLSKQIEQNVKTLLETDDFGAFNYPPSVRKATNFYNGCTNKTMRNKFGYTILRDILLDISWPLIDPKWSGKRSTYKWDEIFARINQKIDFTFLMSIVIAPENHNKSIYKLNISPQWSLVKINISEKLDSESNLLNIDEHKKYVKEAVKLLADKSEHISADVDQQIDFLVDFDIKLTKLKSKSTDNDNAINIIDVIFSNKTDKSSLKNISIKEFTSKYTEIPLLTILQKITSGVFDQNEIISEYETIKLHNVYYFDHLSQILSNTDVRTIANYIGWRLAYSLGRYTTAEFFELDVNYQKAIKKEVQPKLLRETCFDETVKIFSYIIGRLFVDHYFKPEVKNDILKMVKLLKDTFGASMRHNDWITEFSKQKFFEKLDSISDTIAYPDFILNDTLLENYYSELGEIEQKDFFNSVLKTKLWSNKLSLLQLRRGYESISKTEFTSSMPITEVDAYYMISNRIAITVAILQPPFYTPGLPAALNFGTIGSVIGHELNHAFDDEQSKFNKNGLESDWRDNVTKQIYKEKVTCFIDHYNSYYDSTAERAVNGSRTLNENISDNEGVRLAFKTYKNSNSIEESLPGSMKMFSSDQLFFLSFASFFCSNFNRDKLMNYMETNAHAVPKYRILGSLSNLAEFSDAFKCKTEDSMNKENKCILW